MGRHSSQAGAFGLQGHRGGGGRLPENAFAALENALEMDVATLGMDAAITADRVAVIAHDTALNPANEPADVQRLPGRQSMGSSATAPIGGTR